MNVYGQTAPTASGFSSEIRNILETAEGEEMASLGNVHLSEYHLLLEFYSKRGFEAAWTQDDGLSSAMMELEKQIEESKFDGFIPEDYHLSEIKSIIKGFQGALERKSPLEVAYIDVVFSDAYFKLATDLYYGKVSQSALKSGWRIPQKKGDFDFEGALESALAQDKVGESLRQFWPNYQVYARMRESLRAYHELDEQSSKKWSKIPYGILLKPGDKGKQVPELRDRLMYWGDLQKYEVVQPGKYDSIMLGGILKFQQRNGLNPDGVIGPETLRAFNASPKDLIKKVAVNLERLRWLPDTVLQDQFVIVNSANFQVDYVQNNGLDTIFSSPVIVGKRYLSTPVFNGEMSYIVFSPHWTVPFSMVKREMIPEIKKDINYLQEEHLKVLTYAGSEVDPSTIDWGKGISKNFPYIIRQTPGPHNSLGLVKFMFPNKYNVYMHDTPVKSLFSKDIRAFSHGCIRVKKSAELAEKILAGYEGWDKQKIQEAMNGGKEITVMLKKRIPVVVLYLTFWTNTMGKPEIRKDIYGRDEEIASAMFASQR
ncbi:L,D-transpeptidase family protein [Echinicola sediminis]